MGIVYWLFLPVCLLSRLFSQQNNARKTKKILNNYFITLYLNIPNSSDSNPLKTPEDFLFIYLTITKNSYQSTSRPLKNMPVNSPLYRASDSYTYNTKYTHEPWVYLHANHPRVITPSDRVETFSITRSKCLIQDLSNVGFTNNYTEINGGPTGCTSGGNQTHNLNIQKLDSESTELLWHTFKQKLYLSTLKNSIII